MTPDKLCSGTTEHGHQRALFAWAEMARKCGFVAAWDDRCYTESGYALETYGTAQAAHMLDWLHAIPNGGALGEGADKRAAMIRGSQRKAEGVKAGVLDTMLPLPACARSLDPREWPLAIKARPLNDLWFCGLWLEMKKPGKLKNTSNEQRQYIDDMHARGYLCATADNWRDAAKIVERYYGAKAV